MLEMIRYRILMHRLRAEIAALVTENDRQRAEVKVMKTACKAIESIV